ncbi:hypothetical protein HHI36_018678 [Cryptolaemus montrouzieri]|uniref:Uncharacterized protein n=1 Tax=Cryptolaemus montrouzieri TaxID=559131 RepID=A0ABD2P134_9CUCU
MLEPIDKTAEFHIENVWNNFKNSVNDTLPMNLKTERPTKKQRWMTDDILDLMTERALHRNKSPEQYRRLNTEVMAKYGELKQVGTRKNVLRARSWVENMICSICIKKSKRSLDCKNGKQRTAQSMKVRILLQSSCSHNGRIPEVSPSRTARYFESINKPEVWPTGVTIKRYSFFVDPDTPNSNF